MDVFFIIQAILPSVAAIYVGRKQSESKFDSLLKLVTLLLAFTFLFYIFDWRFSGKIPRYGLIPLFFYATYCQSKMWQLLPTFQSGRPRLPKLGLLLLVNVFALDSIWEYTQSRNTSDPLIPLVSPFGEGTFHVVHGGSNSASNYHVEVQAQRFAMDITRVNEFGIATKGLFANRNEDFLIFRIDLYAPCAGEIVGMENNINDNAFGETDEAHALGNYVAIDCHGNTLVLAHMLKDSSKVSVGQRVEEAQILGRVGNSGNSSEPHLHIHAVEGRHFLVEEILETANGLPLTIQGEFLIRNDEFESKGRQ